MNESDERWMKLALEFAEQGRGLAEPNPMVGCVIVRDTECLASGFHQRFGEGHAEVRALDACDQDPQGATVYVTLEPCCHHGKTPPCVDRLIEARVGRVVVATEDPYYEVSGGGIARLLDAGIPVESGLLEREARFLNAPWFKRIRTGRPWVIAKWAMTLDGKTATRTGNSRWISSEASRGLVHQLRGRVDGILTGIQTALADDPLLTARPPGVRTPARIVMDSRLRISLDSQLVTTARQIPTILVAGPTAEPERVSKLADQGCEILRLDSPEPNTRLHQLLDELGKRKMTNLLVEGGGQLTGSLRDIGELDEVHVFVGNHIVGGAGAIGPMAGTGSDKIANSMSLDHVTRTVIGTDYYIFGHVSKEAGSQLPRE